MTQLWFEHAYVAAEAAAGVLVDTDDAGRITAIAAGVESPPAGARAYRGLALPGAVNAHSHAFHRLLRGRTHADGGTFWTWRTVMYRAAAQLNPENLYLLARAVYAEMVTAGYTAVGEFHYVHHQPDGTPYGDHQMERALAAAAREAGIRFVLLDTCYLRGGIGQDLTAEQVRFGDRTADSYVDRHRQLETALAAETDPHGLVSLGAAIHSVRAVPAADLPAFAHLTGPLHIHLSEQPAENEASLAAYGRTPTQVLADAGILGPNLSAVHATHLSDDEISLLGQAGASIVMCPTTEADLADGIGPARALSDAGAFIALGSDQHVTLDPLLELRGLEAGERLGSGERGRFAPEELIRALTAGGARSLGLSAAGDITVGGLADVTVMSTDSVRTIGSVGAQAVLTGTSADVRAVLVGGREVARDGVHTALGDVAELYREVYPHVDLDCTRLSERRLD